VQKGSDACDYVDGKRHQEQQKAKEARFAASQQFGIEGSSLF
jgi:hypothetical protein